MLNKDFANWGCAFSALQLQLDQPYMGSLRGVKSHYSEAEAAEELGVSVQQLRTLIRNHVVDRDEDLNNVAVTTFQPSDLLVLRLLAGKPLNPSC